MLPLAVKGVRQGCDDDMRWRTGNAAVTGRRLLLVLSTLLLVLVGCSGSSGSAGKFDTVPPCLGPCLDRSDLRATAFRAAYSSSSGEREYLWKYLSSRCQTRFGDAAGISPELVVPRPGLPDTSVVIDGAHGTSASTFDDGQPVEWRWVLEGETWSLDECGP